jgi:hypothetical protein
MDRRTPSSPLAFYILSFIFRLLAAFSLYPLVFYLTKDKISSFLPVIFFSVATTGMETTQWVFNMPSYIGIFLMNLFLYRFLLSLRDINKNNLIISSLLFILTVISQPIRMAFLPILVIVFSTYYFLKRSLAKKAFLLLVGYYLCLTLIITLFTNIGTSLGMPIGFHNRIMFVSSFTSQQNKFSPVDVSKTLNPGSLMNMTAQLGNIIIPNEVFLKLDRTAPPLKVLFKLVIPILTGFSFLLLLSGRSLKHFSNKWLIVGVFLAIIWSVVVWSRFILNSQYPLTISEFIPYITGWLFVIAVCLYYNSLRKDTKLKDIIVISTLIIILSFSLSWIRNPLIVQESANRYLIVPASGFAILFAPFLKAFKHKKVFLATVFLPFLIIHIYASRTYLSRLVQFRGYRLTERIRSSVPRIRSLQIKDEPTIVYFETDDEELLYHTLIFGFPVIMYYYQDVANTNNIAYTTSWSEIENYYTNGRGLKSYGVANTDDASITNIYSFSLINGKLADTTTFTRNKLMKDDETR